MNRSLILYIIILSWGYLSADSSSDVDTIIITAEYEEEESHSEKQKSVLSSEDIEALPGETTAEIISNVMGVKLSKYGSEAGEAYISIRGSSPEQVLVLINGKRVNSSQGGGVDLSTIPPESIESIEIIRGGGSAVYGGSAFGGVINIITKRAEETHMNMSYGVTTDLTQKLNTDYSKSTSTYNIYSSINYLNSNGEYQYESGGETQIRENSDISSISSVLNMDWMIDDVILGLSGNLYIADKGVPGLVEFPSVSARLEDFNTMLSLSINYLDIVTGDLGYQNKQRDYEDPDATGGAIDEFHNYHSFSALINFSSSLLTVEFSGSYDYLESTSFDESVDRGGLSLYLNRDLEFSYLTLTPALRWDLYTDAGSNISWSLGYESTPLERVTIKGSSASAYRLPSFNDLFWPSTSYAAGNEDLSPEKAILTDLGCIIDTSEVSRLEVVFFYNYIEDLIQWNPGPGGIWTPDNLGLAVIKGVESEFSILLDSLPIYGYIDAKINYTFLLAENRESGVLYGNELINRPKHVGNITLLYYLENEMVVTFDINYTGLRYITAANTKYYNAYTLFNMNLKVPISEGLELNLFGDNIFDMEYEDYRGFPVPGISAGIVVKYQVGFDE